MARILPAVVHRLLALYGRVEGRQLRTALRDPRAAQESLLREILRRNAGSEIGRRHGFATISGFDDYRERVPVVTADDIAHDVQRIASGERDVLTCERVTMLQPTSGSTGAPKLIPYTRSLQAAIGRGVAAWLDDLFKTYPALLNGTMYWQISPAAVPCESAARAGRNVAETGFRTDAEYLGGPLARLIDQVLAVPSRLRAIDDPEEWRMQTASYLLAAADLALISVWSPSMLLVILETIREEWAALIRGLGTSERSLSPYGRKMRSETAARGGRTPLPGCTRDRLRYLRRFGAQAPEDLGELWPKLAVISGWGDGASSTLVPAIRAAAPGVPFQPKGLIATEGIFSLPLGMVASGITRRNIAHSHIAHSDIVDSGIVDSDIADSDTLNSITAGRTNVWGAVPAIRSHVMELLDERGASRLVNEAEVGSTYSLVITTQGGLYRYRIGDLVRIDRIVDGNPVISFVGREGRVSDLVGEKIDESAVETAIAGALSVLGIAPRAAILSPVQAIPTSWYTLLIDVDSPDELLDRLAAEVDQTLARGFHYGHARRHRQLGPIRVNRVLNLLEHCHRYAAARGIRSGDLKPSALDLNGSLRRWIEEPSGSPGSPDEDDHRALRHASG